MDSLLKRPEGDTTHARSRELMPPLDLKYNDIHGRSANDDATDLVTALEHYLELTKGSRSNASTITFHGQNLGSTGSPFDTSRISSQCSNIKRLLSEGANVNFCNDAGISALMLAINVWKIEVERDDVQNAQSSLDIVCQIIARGANPKVQDRDGLTPLHLAIVRPDSQMTTTDFETTSAIAMDEKLIRLLVKAGARLDPPAHCELPWPRTPLVAAVEEDRLEIVKLLLSLGASANLSVGGKTALAADICSGRDLFPRRISAITATLLEHGVDLKTYASRILASAVSHAPESVERFLSKCYGNPEPELRDSEEFSAKQEFKDNLVLPSAAVPFLSLVDDFTKHEGISEYVCYSCRGFKENASYRKWFLHSESSQTIYRSIASGCTMCQLIKDCLPPAFGEVSLYYYSALSESDTLAKHYFERVVVRGQVGDDFHFGELRFAAVNDETASVLSRLDGLDDQKTDSESAFQLVYHWITTCIKDHGSACHVYGDQLPLLPTRVIDVGPSDGSESPRLLISNGRQGHYTTLSYCWGEKANLCTESGTLESFTTSIPFERIPRTIQEAIMTTRRLGIQYIWVDTLCILQNSLEDWLQEAKNIANIYRNSLLTIAAADSVDSEGGLFRTRSRLRTKPVKMAPHLVPSGLGSPESIYAFGDRQETNDGFRCQTRLDERGWVLQEQLLSPRTLNFSSQELYWDCPCLSASESYPAGIPKDHDRNFERRYFTELKTRILGTSLPLDRERVHMLWQRMLVLYSKRKLSWQTDKLVALAGAANQVSIALNDKLFAGLWVKWLWRDLLWWVDRPRVFQFPVNTNPRDYEELKLKPRQKTSAPLKPRLGGSSKRTSPSATSNVHAKGFQAPTWSWASIQGPISYDFPQGTSYLRYYPCLQILNHREDMLLESKGVSGSITIRGLLFPAKLDPYSSEWATPCWAPRIPKARKMWAPPWSKDDTLAESICWKPDTEDHVDEDILCLVVAASHDLIVALGLTKVTAGLNEYQRVGLLYWSSFYVGVPEEVEYQVLTLV